MLRWFTIHRVEVNKMLWTIAVVLFILWLLGWLIFPIVGGLIHVLLVVAIIVVIFRLITGRRPVV